MTSLPSATHVIVAGAIVAGVVMKTIWSREQWRQKMADRWYLEVETASREMEELKEELERIEAEEYRELEERLTGVAGKWRVLLERVKIMEEQDRELEGRLTGVAGKWRELEGRLTGVAGKWQELEGRLTGVAGKWREILEKLQIIIENDRGTQLTHYKISRYRHRGICLLINNVPELAFEAEKQLSCLFRHLSFHVRIFRGLQMLQMYKVAKEFAKKDHSKFDSFVAIVMSPGRGNDICDVDEEVVSLEQIMAMYTAKKCPSLGGKPKLFFVERITFVTSSNVGDGSTQAQCATDTKIEMQPAFPLVFNGGNCPEGADFLVTCVTSAVDKAKPVREGLFLQVLVDAITKNCNSLQLLDILTNVNECMADKHRSNGVMTAQVPYQNQTLRAKVYLGFEPFPDQDLAQRNCYELEKRPRGYCVIINRACDRPGAKEDERSLKQTFNDLFFTVIVKRDLTKHEMENVAAEYGAKDHSRFDAFVMIVMSHGNDGDRIFGVDKRATSVKDLMVEFQETNCPSLKKKPKVFIIQTCRGGLGSQADNVSSRAVPSTSTQTYHEFCDATSLSDSTLPRSVFPPEAHFVVAFSTVPGYVSFRSQTDGAYFVQSLVKVIREHHHHRHFLEILMQVTELVVKNEEEGSERRPTVQVPACTSTLTRFLYL